MKIKTKLLDTFEKSFERLYQIRKLIREDKLDELSDEIHEFYEQNETLIKKWKAVVDFDSKTNPFPIEKKEDFAVPGFDDVSDEWESIWRCFIDSDIDQRNDGYFHYLDIFFFYQPKWSDISSEINVLFYEWYFSFSNPERIMGGEDGSGLVLSSELSFNKGDNEKDLLDFAKVLFVFVYLGGELGLLRKTKKFEDKEQPKKI